MFSCTYYQVKSHKRPTLYLVYFVLKKLLYDVADLQLLEAQFEACCGLPNHQSISIDSDYGGKEMLYFWNGEESAI